jgi:GxxExxY protein
MAWAENVLQQARFEVLYKGRPVGEYQADMIVEKQIIVEVKAVRALENAHRSQAINYLRATGLRAALLLNFGLPRVQCERLPG